ncbi:hypothetical protein [Nocardia sp. NPDC051463]|uniref:hypothetical protein n=1 Tax=Nocardia sp. NPDC051463 TaxID=3154845 RepID=UPI003442C248
MSQYDVAVGRYFTARNATDDQERAAAVAAAWTEDGSYTDPLADVTGLDLAAAIGGRAAAVPGFRVPGGRRCGRAS